MVRDVVTRRKEDVPEGADYLLQSERTLLDAAQQAVDHARRIGVPGIKALASESAGIHVKVRGGAAEELSREGGRSLSITVLDAGRSGRATTEAIDDHAIRRAVEKAWTIARAVQSDDGADFPDASWLYRGDPQIDMFAPSGRRPSDLTAIALDIERAALARADVQGTAIRVEAAAVSSTDMRWALATSYGFVGSASASMQSRVCRVLAERGEYRASDWWRSAERREDALSSDDAIAAEAVSRTLAGLGGRAVETQSAPVLLDPRVAAGFLLDVASALDGEPQHQRSTFLADAIGTRRIAAHVDLVEDPFEPFGLASTAWDSEGVAPIRRHIVREGVVEGYFLNTRTARKLGMRSTGNADGVNNLTLSSRIADPADDLAALCRKMHRGLLVTRFIGGQFNMASGTYSKAVEGFWVENGVILHPVRDMTIAGEMPVLLEGIVAIGADLYRQNAARSGAILFDEMRIAGR